VKPANLPSGWGVESRHASSQPGVSLFMKAGWVEEWETGWCVSKGGVKCKSVLCFPECFEQIREAFSLSTTPNNTRFLRWSLEQMPLLPHTSRLAARPHGLPLP
jgi:hypothetical protein